MKIAVLGATGTIGSLISTRLDAAGHEVIRASRSLGLDVFTGEGLDGALRGADAVVDCLNIETLSSRKAVRYFTTTAGNVAQAARRTGAGRVVCVSIAGAADPQVSRWFGYYAGKAAQEEAYRSSGLPVTIIHSTQWYELLADVVRRASLGPVAVLPTMRMAAVAAGSVAELAAAEAVGKTSGAAGAARTAGEAAGAVAVAEDGTIRVIAVRGPEVASGAEIARRVLAARGSIGGRRPRIVIEAPYLGRAIATGALVPDPAIVDDVTLDEWLAAGHG